MSAGAAGQPPPDSAVLRIAHVRLESGNSSLSAAFPTLRDEGTKALMKYKSAGIRGHRHKPRGSPASVVLLVLSTRGAPAQVKLLKTLNAVCFPVSYQDSVYTEILTHPDYARLAYFNDVMVPARDTRQCAFRAYV